MLKRFGVVVTVLALLLAGCSKKTPDYEAGDLTGHIVLYTSEPQDLATEMLDAFVELNPGVTYEIFRSGTGAVTSKIDTELQTGSTEADIIWFADIGYMKSLDDDGLILHYTPDNAGKIPEQYVYNDGMAYEVRLIYNVLAYNTTKLTAEEAPKDWFDVTDTKYRSVFAMANPNYSGGAFTTLVVHIQHSDLIGWDFYDDLAANDTKYEQSNGTLTTKLASGEYTVVSVVDFMVRNAKNEGSPVEVVWPESGAVLIPTPVALMNTIDEKNLDAAKAFVNFMLDVESQKLFVEQGYIPVIEDAGLPEGAPAVEDIEVLSFDLDYFVENGSAIRAEYTATYGNE